MRNPVLIMIVVGVIVAGRTQSHRAEPTPAEHVGGGPDKPIESVIERRDSGHFTTVAEVNGEPIHVVVDTGADITALTEEDARRAHVSLDPTQYQMVGRGAAGSLTGQKVHLDSISLDGKRVSDISAVVLRGADVSLLGQNYLRHVSVSIDGDTMRIR